LEKINKRLNVIYSLNISVRRLGGAYGGKIELPTAVAAATAVAATALKRPVRLWMPLEHNMRMFGKRNPYVFDYKVSRELLSE
jgi:xanthine dehydrogenase molybdopterin-binding subunit B